MQKVKIKINILNHGSEELPKYETSGSSGMDLKAAINNPISIKKKENGDLTLSVNIIGLKFISLLISKLLEESL